MSRRLLLAIPPVLVLLWIAGISGPTSAVPLAGTRAAYGSTTGNQSASSPQTSSLGSTPTAGALRSATGDLPQLQATPSQPAASSHPPFPPPPVPPPSNRPVTRPLIWFCPPLLPASPLQPLRHSVCGSGFHAGETVIIRISSPRGLYWWTTIATSAGSFASPLPSTVCRYVPGTLHANGTRGSVSNGLPLIAGCLAA